jgi:hypothetical protein
MGEDTKIMNKWKKAKIIGNLSIAFILAAATIIGSTYIPNKINRNSLESQKIIQLSQLVPQLYDSSVALRPSIIAMASYGAPAVSFLLLVLDDATENEKDNIIKDITSTMKYMDRDAKKEIQAKLEMEIEQLNQRRLAHNVEYIGHIVRILTSSRLDYESLRILEKYFNVVSEFTDNRYKLQGLNGCVIRALSDNDHAISRLRLDGLDFEDQDLKGIDFTNANLKNANLRDSRLYDCIFTGAILDSCDLRGAKFCPGYEDSPSILRTFRKFAESNWREAIMDSTVYDILIELDNKPQDTMRLLVLTDILKDGF